MSSPSKLDLLQKRRGTISVAGKLLDEAKLSKVEAGRRLRLTRKALGLSQQAFAESGKVGKSAISNVENGAQRIGLDTAIELVKAHNITLDWIYFGDEDGLKGWLVKAIYEAEKSEK